MDGLSRNGQSGLQGMPLAVLVDSSNLLKRVDAASVGPERDERLEWLDTFDIWLNPFTDREELMSGRDYDRLCERWNRNLDRYGRGQAANSALAARLERAERELGAFSFRDDDGRSPEAYAKEAEFWQGVADGESDFRGY